MLVHRHALLGDLSANPVSLLCHDDRQPIAQRCQCRRAPANTTASDDDIRDLIASADLGGDLLLFSACGAAGKDYAGRNSAESRDGLKKATSVHEPLFAAASSASRGDVLKG